MFHQNNISEDGIKDITTALEWKEFFNKAELLDNNQIPRFKVIKNVRFAPSDSFSEISIFKVSEQDYGGVFFDNCHIDNADQDNPFTIKQQHDNCVLSLKNIIIGNARIIIETATKCINIINGHISKLSFDEDHSKAVLDLLMLNNITGKKEGYADKSYFEAIRYNFCKIFCGYKEQKLYKSKVSKFTDIIIKCEINRLYFDGNDKLCHGSTIRSIEFSTSGLISNKAFFNNTRFKCPIIFTNCAPEKSLPQNTVFQNTEFDTNPDHIGEFRILKDIMSIHKNEHAEISFAAYEMESRHKGINQGHLKNWYRIDYFAEAFVSTISFRFNRFGKSYLQPIKWLTITYILFSIVYCGIQLPYNLLELTTTLTASFHVTLIPISLINKNFATDTAILNYWVKAIHVSFSSVLWYLLIVGIKKRFRQH